MVAPRRKPVVMESLPAPAISDSFAGLTEMQNNLPYNPLDPNNGESLDSPKSPLALAADRMQQDRELEDFSATEALKDAEEDQLAAATAEFPESEDQEAHVSIWRYPLGGGKREWMHDATMSEWRTMGKAWIALTFGAGKFEVMMYRGGQRGLYKRPSCNISREGAELQRKRWRESNPPAEAPASVGGGGTERLAQVMIAGFTQLGELIARQNNGANGKAEFLKEMLLYKEIFAQPAAQPKDAGVGSTLDLAVKIAGLIHPGVNEKTTLETFAEIAKDLAPPLFDALKASAASGQLALPNPSAPRPSNPEKPDVNMIQNAIIKAQLKGLIAKAEKNSDPNLYAEVIFDNLDNIPGEFIERFINDPQWLQWLAQFDARVLQHEPWFTELYTELRRIIQEDQADGGANSPSALTPGGSNLTGAPGASINPGIHLAGGPDFVPDASDIIESDSETE